MLFANTANAHNHNAKEYKFIKNLGQWNQNINYKVALPEGNLYLESNRILVQLTDLSVIAQIHTGAYKGDWDDAILKQHVYSASFVGANPNPTIFQEDLLEEYNNYYLGKDPTKWKSNVPLSHAVVYKELYNGVDLHIFSHNGSIKYEFHCANYAAAQQIKLEYDGYDDLSVKNGIFTIETSLGDVSEEPPVVFHTSPLSTEQKNDTIAAKYKLQNNQLTFDLKVSNENLLQPIVIDPTLIFSTYSGSTTTNFGFTSTFDSEGFLYAGGIVFGTGYPVTRGAFQTTFSGGVTVPAFSTCDVVITKYDTSGTSRVYSTYLGGTAGEMPHSMVVNSRDELFVYGTTGSTNFPTTANAYQDTLTNPTVANSRRLEVAVPFNLGSDMFITRFNTAGSALIGSTYIGGSDHDGLNNPGPHTSTYPRVLNYNYADVARGEIDIDRDDNVYVVGSTWSRDFPITGSPAYPSYQGGNQDGIICKFKQDLDTLIWSSFFGGAFSDAIYSLAFSGNGNITVAGGTNSSILFPSTSLPTYNSYQGGRADGFVAEFSANGQTLVASTYFGSNEYDQIYFVERDRFDNVYVFGQTEDPTSKLITNALYSTASAGQFVTKFTPAIDSIVWSTKFGTPAAPGANARPNISPTAFLVDLCNSIYLSGWGGTTNGGRGNNATLVTGMDTTSDAFQPLTDGSDLYLAVLADDASRLIYGTFFGGISAREHVDGGTSRFDRKGKIYQSVCAGCPVTNGGTSDFPTKPNPGAASNLNGARNWNGFGGCNNAVFKMDFLLPAVVAEFQIPRQVCIKDSVQLRNLSLEQGSSNFIWYFGNGDSSTLKNPKLYYDSIGTYKILLLVSDSASCNLFDTISKTVSVIEPKSLTLPNDSLCIGEQVVLGINQTGSYRSFTWLPGDVLEDSTKMRPTASPTAPTLFTLLLDNGICIDSNFQYIHVDSLVDAAFAIPDSICAPDTISIQNNSTILKQTSIRWELSGIGSDTIVSPIFIATQAGNYTLKLVLEDSTSCNAVDSISQPIQVKQDTSFGLSNVLSCNNELNSIGIVDNPNYTYQWQSGFGKTDSAISRPFARTVVDTIFRLFINKGVCVDTALQPMTADSIRIRTSNDTVICSNVPTLGLVGSHFGTGTNYQWSSRDDFSDQLNSSSLDSNVTISYDTLFENTFYMQSISSRGCRTADSTKVFINDFGIRITDSVDLCLNDTTFLTVRSLIPDDTLQVTWNPFKDIFGPNDTTSIKVNPSESRVYNVKVETSRNCRADRNVYVFVSDLDTQLAVLVGSRDTIVSELTSELDVTPKGYAYLWTPTAGLSNPESDNPIANPDTTTTYTVAVFDPLVPNCVVERNFKVLVEELFCEEPYLFLPNTFTPNDDGVNDELLLYGKYIEEMNLQIFNRWGELVFESNDQQNGWDGTYDGEKNWPEVFVYQLYVKCIDGQEFKKKGDVTLIK